MPSLTMPEAQTRAALLTVDGYEWDVDLTGDGDSFRSTTTVRFRSHRHGAATFIELRPRRLHAAWLNGLPLDPSGLRDGRLSLPQLQPDNVLVVEAEFDYSHASEGMHRFVDPIDEEVYVYAQPSIAQAPAFMACFDQPDLKAPVTLRVSADPGWLVRANAEGRQLSPGRWEFAPTPAVATYLITLAAGPFHESRSEHDGIPLGVYARASLATHAVREAPEIFEITAACLDHYHHQFGIRYPFGKYDQVFAPEFSWGAMEFPGCVLIRDEMMFSSVVTDSQRQRRAVLLAHEMAHMWFGNLVTMRWWDDLWLNESFADYLGWRVVAEATRWRTAWSTYSVLRKTWGLAADQRPSTHPVAAAEVSDTAAALANFDGISYAKGSAVLRQLVAWVGDEAFWAGLRAYFDTHAYGNATLADLLAALSRASGRDLTGWAEAWLRQPQVNTVTPVVSLTDDGRYATVAVQQSAPAEFPTLRPHRLGVAVYDVEPGGEAVVTRQRELVDMDPQRDGDRTEVPALVGTSVGALLLVNDGDLSYAKVRLAASAGGRELARVLPRLADPLARAVAWGAARDATRDGELPAAELVALTIAGLPAETEVPVFETMLAEALDPVIGQYLPPLARPAAYAALADACREVLQRAEPGSGRQLAAARGLVGCAVAGAEAWLSDWLTGAAPAGLVVDADLRWSILDRLAVLGAVGEAEIAAEQRRDGSARGVQAATRCRAGRPDLAAKEQAWRLVASDRELSNRIVVAAAAGLWRPEQSALTAPFVARYFSEINETAGWRSEQLLSAVSQHAYPRFAVAPTTLAAATEFLARADLHPIVRREVVDATDDLRRAVVARALAERVADGVADGDRVA